MTKSTTRSRSNSKVTGIRAVYRGFSVLFSSLQIICRNKNSKNNSMLFNIEGLNREQLKEVVRQIDEILFTLVSKQFIDIQEASDPLFDKLSLEREGIVDKLYGRKGETKVERD